MADLSPFPYWGNIIALLIDLLSTAPTVPPSNAMATRISATEVRVSWDPLPLTNDMGPPTETSFLVRYRVVEARRVTRNAMDTASFVEVVESGVVVDELEPHLVYGISVAAKNDMGVGDYSAEIITECKCVVMQHGTPFCKAPSADSLFC